jgi:hypothetical protein
MLSKVLPISRLFTYSQIRFEFVHFTPRSNFGSSSSSSRSTNLLLRFAKIPISGGNISEIVETMLHPQFDQNSASLFAGPGFMPSQPTQAVDSSALHSKVSSTFNFGVRFLSNLYMLDPIF